VEKIGSVIQDGKKIRIRDRHPGFATLVIHTLYECSSMYLVQVLVPNSSKCVKVERRGARVLHPHLRDSRGDRPRVHPSHHRPWSNEGQGNSSFADSVSVGDPCHSGPYPTRTSD
jgi:hypothetical protein